MTLKTPILDSLLCSKGPSKGLIIIFDMHNTGVKHLMRTKVETLRLFFRYLQDALPARLEAMHIINCTSFIDMVMAMIKPFMKSDVISRVILFPFPQDNQLNLENFQMHLHQGTNYENFHKNFVPRSCLPADLGGELKPVEKLHQKHCQEFARLRNFFNEEEKEAKLLNK